MKKRIVSFVLTTVMVVSTLLNAAVPATAASSNATPQEAPLPPSGNLNYFSNQGKLSPNEFVQLPMGAVTAKDWLLEQLYLQKNGLTGAIHDDYPLYGPNNGWRGGNGDGWEKGAYYLRGLMSLAWVLDDQELKDKSMEWIDFILNSQRENGFMGPLGDGDGSSNGWDWWPRMVILQVIRDYYEATSLEGNPDPRVLPFFEKYFRYQEQRLPGKQLESWAASRGGDNVEVLLWYYNHIYDENNPTASDWIVDLAELLASQTISQDSRLNWNDVFNNTTVREHVVNTTQAMKTPAVLSQLPGREQDKDSLKQGIFNMGLDHGRVDKLANSDEAARDNLPYRGAELCSIVESLLSNEISIAITGESWLGDDMERIAYNSLPAGYAPDYTGHSYFQAQNQVMATHGNHEFDCEHGDDSAFGAPTGFECCFPNMHMGWPKFVQNMWMATKDDGLAVITYGPNKVTAKVSDGKTAVFDETTDYPFKDTVTLDYSGETAQFPLKLRLPEWCTTPSITVNGAAVDLVNAQGFVTIDRTWKANDKVVATFPMEVRTSNWYNNSSAVEYGPLIFSLKVEEDWRIATDDAAREIQYDPVGEFDRKEVYPASAWNYGLVIDPNHPADSFQIETGEVGLQPFTLSNAPITIKATGQTIPEWKLKGNVVPESPYSPIAPNTELQKEVELVPYGCTRLHMTLLPAIGNAPEGGIITKTLKDASIYKEKDVQTVEFDNVVVPSAEDYTLKISFTGSGTLRLNINGKYEEAKEFTGTEPMVIENLNSIVPGTNKYFHFGYGKYNNIRFFGNDNVQIDKIEVLPVNLFTQPEIKEAVTGKDNTSVTLNTNIDRSAGFYCVHYGTQSGNYTKTAENFYDKKAVITGLDPAQTYYFQVSMLVNGTPVVSEEVMAASATEQPLSFKDDFSDPTASKAKWTLYDPSNAVTFQDGQLNVSNSENLKIMAGTGEEDWADYAIETTLSGPDKPNRDFGVMFRCLDVTGENADSYKGYYVGIDAIGGGLNIGFANNGWNDIAKVKAFTYEPGKEYLLKILVKANMFKVYVDGVLCFEHQDDKYPSGSVGLRSWNQPFTASSFEVRNLTLAEEELFGSPQPDPDPPVEMVPEFHDDFEDIAASQSKWRLCGSLDKMHFTDGKIAFDSSNNVKAVAGDETWTNYVAETAVILDGKSDQNAGLMYLVNSAGNQNSDDYNGYYFGIGNNPDGTGYYITGYSDKQWHQTERKNMPSFENGSVHRLKAVIYENMAALFIDDQFVTKFINTRFKSGMIGLRSYEKPFYADDVSVRKVTQEDSKVFDGWTRYVDETFGAFETAQLKFPKFSTTRDYKIVYGTEPGIYTTEVYGLYHSQGGSKSDKLSVSLPENDKNYYMRIIALNGKEETAVSDEVVVHTGDRWDISEDLENLKIQLETANTIPEDSYTEGSYKRLDLAIQNANQVIASSTSNLMDSRLAKNCLIVGVNQLEEVEAPVLLDRLLITPPEKSQYLIGEPLDLTGLVVKAIYTDDTEKTLAGNDYRVTGFDSNTPGEKKIVVAYTEGSVTKTGTFSVTMKEKPVVPVKPDKTLLRTLADKVSAMAKGKYTDSSWNHLQLTLTEARAALASDKADQSEIDRAAEHLLDAVIALEKADTVIEVEKVDKAPLQLVYDSFKNMLNKNYTDTSWNALLDALAGAASVLSNPNADKAQVNNAVSALLKASSDLVVKPVVQPPAKPVLKKGSSYYVKGLRYKVTDTAKGKAAVTITGAQKKTITSLTIPASVTLLGVKCNVTSINSKAFKNYTRLSKVTIGANVKTIGSQAFYGDKKLKTITIQSKVLKSIGSKAFTNIYSKAVVKVPKNKKSAYTKLFKNKGLKSNAKIK